ncbi:hypothetical protein NE237_003517 [Protea cynaroides]|uniref:Uncharacterized protein n=1 Tax=Protea cynaroides TaxID=273540 RepID=A0A9Q0KGZ1_9MAGN|nr:hypothetical protein NE237_003517 [Protea cynaroides]
MVSHRTSQEINYQTKFKKIHLKSHFSMLAQNSLLKLPNYRKFQESTIKKNSRKFPLKLYLNIHAGKKKRIPKYKIQLSDIEFKRSSRYQNCKELNYYKGSCHLILDS